MTTRRYVQINGELIEVTDEARDFARRADHILWNDRAYQDMNDPRFRSRSEHREYMKRNGLTTVDDFKQHDERMAKQRADFYRGVDAERKTDLARAFTVKRGGT
jgi:hypothetical protein